ncbi:MAG: DUF4174 domain-containing protein [Bacteroidota bacterium]
MAQPDSHLAAYRWEQRLVLVFAPDDSHPQFSQQMQEVQRETAEWQDRDLGVFQLWPKGGLTPEQEALNREQSQRLYRQYGVVPGEFVVILIGKDGGEKARRKDEILSNETLFPIIDAMPMRRSEMRRNPKRN